VGGVDHAQGVEACFNPHIGWLWLQLLLWGVDRAEEVFDVAHAVELA